MPKLTGMKSRSPFRRNASHESAPISARISDWSNGHHIVSTDRDGLRVHIIPAFERGSHCAFWIHLNFTIDLSIFALQTKDMSTLVLVSAQVSDDRHDHHEHKANEDGPQHNLGAAETGHRNGTAHIPCLREGARPITAFDAHRSHGNSHHGDTCAQVIPLELRPNVGQNVPGLCRHCQRGHRHQPVEGIEASGRILRRLVLLKGNLLKGTEHITNSQASSCCIGKRAAKGFDCILARSVDVCAGRCELLNATHPRGEVEGAVK
mmetsp:Transcript_44042/g.104207  ORF Transcript_44042/g.104207 Transcript_44042/m.104207 type:complete len:264 (-) Transcript_44042:680-1471(-)